jgi:hypothetical protein
MLLGALSDRPCRSNPIPTVHIKQPFFLLKGKQVTTREKRIQTENRQQRGRAPHTEKLLEDHTPTKYYITRY